MSHSISMSLRAFLVKLAFTIVVYGLGGLFTLVVLTKSEAPDDRSSTSSGAIAKQSAHSNGLHMPIDTGVSAKPIPTSMSLQHNRFDPCMVALDGGEPRRVSFPGYPLGSIDDCQVHIDDGFVEALDTGFEDTAAQSPLSRQPDRIESYIATPTRRPSAARTSFAKLAASKCDHENLALKRGVYTLLPGVYCGGIVALGASQIKLEPGVFIVKDGPFYLGGTSSLSGTDVGLFFTGRNAVFGSGALTKVDLSASAKGPMSNLLFLQDKKVSSKGEFVIRSYDKQSLEGALYLPKGRLVLELTDLDPQPGNKVSPSAIAHQIEIRSSRSLYRAARQTALKR